MCQSEFLLRIEILIRKCRHPTQCYIGGSVNYRARFAIKIRSPFIFGVKGQVLNNSLQMKMSELIF